MPYYLLFYPNNEELSVFRLDAGRYVSVTPNAAGRLPIPELELEVGLVDGWVRYWFRDELLPLPGELLRRLNDVRGQLEVARVAQQAAERRATDAEAEIARLREALARAEGRKP